MAFHAIEGAENFATALQAILQITNVTTRRAHVHEFGVGAEGTMADEVGTYALERFTVAPTDTVVTPRPLDPDIGESSEHTDCGENGAGTGTVTANSELWTKGVHFRAAFRWVAVPGGEIIAGLVSANGIVMRAKAPTTTPLTHCTMHFSE